MPSLPVVDQTAMNMQPLAAPSVTRERNDAPQQLQQALQAVQQAGALAMKTG